jgi:hypothetical protein
VRDAYAQKAWAFGKGKEVEQCQREHYAQRLEEQKDEGCRVEGGLRVNKVVGNFHLAPGRSFSRPNAHVHDLKNYWATEKGDSKHDFTHIIHHLRFGPQLPPSVVRQMSGTVSAMTSGEQNPLDNTRQDTDDPAFNYMYFLKIVPTSFLPLGREKNYRAASRLLDDSSEIGAFGIAADGSIETHQYSATRHKRSLSGGDDSAEGHAERMHSQGGIPGVFFSYVSFGVVPCRRRVVLTLHHRTFPR